MAVSRVRASTRLSAAAHRVGLKEPGARAGVPKVAAAKLKAEGKPPGGKPPGDKPAGAEPADRRPAAEEEAEAAKVPRPVRKELCKWFDRVRR